MLSPKRILTAFQYSKKGFQSAWKTEAAFRDNVFLICVVQTFCFYSQPDWLLWLFFLACNVLLLTTELLNTGLEYLADQISREHHPLLGSAKDVGSASVFMVLLLNTVTFTIIIWRYFIK